VCVHYLNSALFPCFHSSLVLGGHLYIEKVGGQGQNYLELPMAGALRELLSPLFFIDWPRSNQSAGGQPTGPEIVAILGIYNP
jgi:hypothetical protein